MSTQPPQQGPQNRQLVEEFIQFFRDYYHPEIGTLAQRYPSEQRSLEVDYADLYKFDRDLAERYTANPGQFVEYAEEALRQFDLPADVDLGGAHVRITNLDETTDIRKIRVNDDNIGQLIAVGGIVRKATDVRPKITEAAFECQRCGTMSYIPQDDGGFSEPHECQGCERQGPFQIDFDQSNFVDAQKLRVQESPEGLRGGETPQSVDVYLEDDITGRVTAGDSVTVTGILHIEQQTSGKQKTPVFDYYMEGRSLAIEDEDFDDLDITEDDVNTIRELSEDPDIYDRMVDSVAPSIYGYDTEKLAIILQMFGGVTKHLPDDTRVRGDTHMLLVGDPGVGKSQLIRYVKNIAPRSVYTSGKGSSAAGLTASAVRDDFSDTGQWTLEAGALVLADRGVAAIDELDKMDDSDRSAMHEALEQQEVSVAKAGITATLKSRCSVVGAANPKYGRFDQYEPIGEQIELDPALISRFDLIFTVTDSPDVDHDDKIATHILDSNEAGQMHAHRETLDRPEVTDQETNAALETVDPDIEPELLRKYIAYARSTTVPVFTAEAKAEIRRFYVGFRSDGTDEDSPVPVTARKLEALVRLAEASARVRLSNQITVEDSQRVIKLVKSSLRDVGMDPETEEFDADIVETGTSKTQRDRIQGLQDLIENLSYDYENRDVPIEDIVDEADEKLGLSRTKVEKTIERLKFKDGVVHEPSNGIVRWMGGSK